MGNRWSILSVTDLHYEQPSDNYVDDAKELDWWQYRDNVFPNFDAILKAISFLGPCDLVSLGGDITTHGRYKGIQRFDRETMARLIDIAGKPEAVCVVPGNHDVTWGLDSKSSGAFDKKFAAIRELVDKWKVTSCLMPTGELKDDPDDELKFVRPPSGPVYIDRDRKLLVACVNSAIRCGEVVPKMKEIAELGAAAESAIGTAAASAAREPLERLNKALPPYLIRDVAHVTEFQRRIVSDELQAAQHALGDDWGSYLRVGLLHHHLLQFPHQVTEHRGYEALVDRGRVLAMFADFDFDLVLTGHKHQPYEVVHRTPSGRDLLIVGGPTVGGYPTGGSFRGVRWIDVEEDGDQLLIRIADIGYEAGEGNARAHVEQLRAEAQPVAYARRPGTALEQRARRSGYSYRDVSSITIVDPDGDARRVVECEDFVVTDRESRRAGEHSISLSPTSGYLAGLRAAGRNFSLRVQDEIPRDQRPRTWRTILRFDQPVGIAQPASYSYRWFAVNAFALDTDQFDFLHGRAPGRFDNVEFTHFFTRDPIRELTVVVRFPPRFKPSEPRLRIAFVDDAEPDARKWSIDSSTQDALQKAHALRFYEWLNIAALRVSLPRPDLSYGIQWTVPPPPPSPAGDEIPKAFWDHRRRRPEACQASLIEVLRQMFIAARRSFLGDWSGPIDGALMWFDASSDQPIVILAGAMETARRAGRGAAAIGASPLPYQGNLAYGDGIAGRAFKTNRLRVYVAGDRTDESDEPDYYTRIPGGPLHQILVSMPVHAPEPDEVFRKNARVYESKRPYGVLNIGSVSPDCPLKDLRVPERIMGLLTFQHSMNVMIYGELTRLVRRFRLG